VRLEIERDCNLVLLARLARRRRRRRRGERGRVEGLTRHGARESLDAVREVSREVDGKVTVSREVDGKVTCAASSTMPR
jgi:hypothetical protein